MKPVLWLFVFIALGFRGYSEDLPPASRLDELVERLGAETHEVREEAFEALSIYVERFPRFMLLALADRYGENEDLEVRFRLEALLEPLAGKYLFGLSSGFIGINMEWWGDGNHRSGIHVISVLPGHAGEKAGMRQGDVILRVNGMTVSKLGSLEAFSNQIAGKPPGTFVEFEIKRADEIMILQFSLDARPVHLDQLPEQVMSRISDWLRDLSGRLEPEDPTFPVGHFPKDGVAEDAKEHP